MAGRNKLTLDDLHLLLEELMVVCERWYRLGLQLGVRIETLDRIRLQFSNPIDRLREILKTWLTTSDKPCWTTLTDVLRSRSVQASQLAGSLERKYCLRKDMHESYSTHDLPGNKLTLDDLGLLLEEIMVVCPKWYHLGLQLGVRISTLDSIRTQFPDPKDQLLEMLKTWLTSSDNTSWKTLTDALGSRSVGVSHLASVLETKYCLVEETEDSQPVTPTTPVSQEMVQTLPSRVAESPPSTSDHHSPPPILQPAVGQGDTSSVHLPRAHLGAVAQLIQGQLGYRKVQLIKTEPLGTGSYGAVYKAMCDDLPCAAKILHPTLFQFNDPGATTVMIRFQQECNFLSAIRHPNIVQYLGSYQDRGTRLPVLLIELMDDSLTRFLEQSQEPLPYHIQVNICYDIALALAYLHSNDIIHRDLSSNNVLLIGAGNRAKVSDFGMAKLFSVNRATMTPQTMCPGTLPYMSPEALDDPPLYTKKLDTFSFGVLGIQIITRQFPDPGLRTKKVSDPLSPTGSKYVPVLETERRKAHIGLINRTHPLLSIVTSCLKYNGEDRPSAQELCHRLAALKEAPQYGDSVLQARERSRAVHRERQIKELRQEEEFHEQIRVLQQTLHVRKQEYEAVTQEKDHVIEAIERRLLKLNQQLAVSERVTAQLQKTIQELQEEKKRKFGKFPMVTQKDSINGAEVIGEVEFRVQTEGGSFEWKGFGIRLHVPKDSLSADVRQCKINIRASLSGQFQLPEGTDLLSPVFWISAPCKFTKPVTLELQHCALAEDEAALSNLGFVSTKCSQRELPFKFTTMGGGVFTTHSTYGSIKLSHFSGVGVTGRKGIPRSYCAHLYHTKKKDYEWRFYFVIIQDLHAKNMVVREHYGHFADQEATFRVRFEHSEITLGISDDGLVTREGWRITPFTAPTITKKDVDQFKEGQWIPECQLVVQWEREDQKPVRLRHKVNLTGAKAPHTFIYLILDPAGSSHLTTSTPPATAGTETALPQHSGKLHISPQLRDLMNFVAAKIPEKWREVGIGLGLDTTDIKRIEAEVPTHKSTPCYVDVFYTWKNKGTKEYTWDTLLKALRTPSVDASKLANTIEGQLS